ncbi:hypothetical protein CLU79DRAFT_809754, partial [Phycomyces nitens]
MTSADADPPEASPPTEQEAMLDALCVLDLPDINTPALSHESSLEEFLDGFDTMATEMNRWLETAHLTVFTIEQQVKQDIVHDTLRLEQTIDAVQPSIESLGDLVEVMQLKQDIPGLIDRKRAVRISIIKLQSEWSGLQHFLSSVKKTIKDSTDRKGLLLDMERILLEVSDLSTLIFQFQEHRHATAALNPHEHEPEDGLMSKIDNKVMPVFHEVERVYGRMMNISSIDTNGVLSRKHRVVQERWESLRLEIDDLKYDLKEDHWLTVFNKVANQAEVLIHKLEKTVAFESRFKNSSSINRMMASLGDGISKRPNLNAAFVERYEATLNQWNQLKITID